MHEWVKESREKQAGNEGYNGRMELRKKSLLVEEMEKRWCTSHMKDQGGRRVLGLTFMGERKRRSNNIRKCSERCMLGWSGMLAGLLKLKNGLFLKLKVSFCKPVNQ